MIYFTPDCNSLDHDWILKLAKKNYTTKNTVLSGKFGW